MKKVMWIQWAVIAGLIVTIALMKGCNNKTFKNLQFNIDSLTLANQRLDSVKNKREQTVYTQIAVLTDNQRELKKLSDSMFNLKSRDEKILKNVIAYFKQHTKIVIDSIPIPYTDSVIVNGPMDTSSVITVPRSAALYSPYFSINETINKSEVVIDNLEIPDSQYVRIVENRGGFLRRVNGKLKFHVPKQIQFQTLHTNPYLKVTGQSSVVYIPRAKPKWLLNGVLIGIGVFLGTKL